ncbi:ATP-binding cassette domain-containing protein, partial [Pediococcus pentosaceus]
MNLLEINNITMKFPMKVALDNISLEISDESGVTALIGPNGAGKTTLIKCIMGLNQEYEGSIVYQTNKISYCP